MGYSIQDLNVRVAILEDKLDLVMKAFSVQKRYENPHFPGEFITETKSLLDIYRELKGLGAEIENSSQQGPVQGPAKPLVEIVNG